MFYSASYRVYWFIILYVYIYICKNILVIRLTLMLMTVCNIMYAYLVMMCYETLIYHSYTYYIYRIFITITETEMPEIHTVYLFVNTILLNWCQICFIVCLTIFEDKDLYFIHQRGMEPLPHYIEFTLCITFKFRRFFLFSYLLWTLRKDILWKECLLLSGSIWGWFDKGV